MNEKRVIRLDPKTRKIVAMLNNYTNKRTALKAIMSGLLNETPIEARKLVGMNRVLQNDFRKPFLLSSTSSAELNNLLEGLALFVNQQLEGMQDPLKHNTLVQRLSTPQGSAASESGIAILLDQLGGDLIVPEDTGEVVRAMGSIEMFRDMGRGLQVGGVKPSVSFGNVEADERKTILQGVIDFCENDATLFEYIITNVHQGLYFDCATGMQDYVRVNGHHVELSSAVSNPRIEVYNRNGQYMVDVQFDQGVVRDTDADAFFFVNDQGLQSSEDPEHVKLSAKHVLLTTKAAIRLDCMKEPKPAEGAQHYKTMGVKPVPEYIEYSSNVPGVQTSRPGIDYSYSELEDKQAQAGARK